MDLPHSEPYYGGNLFVAGSTRSGKSTCEVYAVIAAVEQTRDMAIVVIDPHPNSLAWKCLMYLTLLGHERRIIFDQIPYLKRIPRYRLLTPSAAADPHQRRAENEQTAREFAQLLCWRREITNLAIHPQTEDWTIKATLLAVDRDPDQAVPASYLPFAFLPEHPHFKQLVDGCVNEVIVEEFRGVAAGRIKRAEYLPAKRLVDGLCSSEAFALRCGTSFGIGGFLHRGGILLMEGGQQGVSADSARVVMGAVIHQVLNYVRRRRRPWPRVLLAIDEAINWGFVDETLLKACAETQKMGLDIHVLAQGPSLNERDLADLLTNCTRHHWHFLSSPAYAAKAAADLGDPDYKGRITQLDTGERLVTHQGYVSFEALPDLPDPWVFPGLADAQVAKTLARIRRRPEFEVPPCHDTSIQRRRSATKPSASEPKTTSASLDTSRTSSPAKRLSTDG